MSIALQTGDGLQAQLELARQVQLRLLPDRRCCLSDWEVAFSYESAGFVSGDYVDLIPAGADAFYFALGDVLVNAGHNPVLLVEGAEVEIIAAASLRLGMFCSTDFTSVRRRLSPESTLFLYSDGITESTDNTGNEFDLNRLAETLLQSRKPGPI